MVHLKVFKPGVSPLTVAFESDASGENVPVPFTMVQIPEPGLALLPASVVDDVPTV